MTMFEFITFDQGTDLLCNDTHKQDGNVDHAKIKFDFEKGKSSTFLETTTVGGRMFFMVGMNNDLVDVWVNQRFALPILGRVSFIQSSCMVNLGQCCIGILCAIKLSKDSAFKLAVISALYDMRIDTNDTLEYYEWTGSIISSGHPECFDCISWEAMKSDFTHRSVCVADIHTAYLINQVRGKVPLLGLLKQDLRNTVDGGVQCSKEGPDKWLIPTPAFERQLVMSFNQMKLAETRTGHANLLCLNSSLTKPKKRRKITGTIPKEEPQLIKSSHIPPKKIPQANQSGLILIIRDSKDETLTPDMAKIIPNDVKGTLNFGSITDSKNKDCAMQTFYCLSPANHDQLCDSYPDGLLLHGDYMDQIVLDTHHAG